MEEGRIWLISDTHYNHRRMVEFGRPEDFEAKLEQSCLEIGEKDTLIHMGDVCIGRDAEMHEKYIQPIKGTKILVRGNHDQKSDTWYMNHGWDFVCESFVKNCYGMRILFTHIPSHKTAVLFDAQVHGHTHGNTHRIEDFVYDPSWHIEIAPEITDYRPVLLKTIVEKHQKRDNT